MNISIDTQSEIATIDVGKLSTVAELQEAVLALLNHPDHIDGMESIFDFRQADLLKVSHPEIIEYAKWLSPLYPRLSKRLATVVTRDLEFGVIRMWNTYSEGLVDQNRMIFRDMDAAREWLLSGRVTKD